MARVEPHDLPICASAALDLVEQRREAPIALFEAPAGGLGVRRRWRRRHSARMVAVGDFDTLHRTFLGWRIDRLSKLDAEPYSPTAQPECGAIRRCSAPATQRRRVLLTQKKAVVRIVKTAAGPAPGFKA